MEEEIIIYDPPELLLNLPIIENEISQQPLELWQIFCSLSPLNFNQRATISAPSETGLEENKKLFSWQNKHQAKSLNKQIAKEAKQQNRQSYDTPSEQQRECSAIKMRQNNWGEARRGREKFLVTNTLYTSQRETFLFRDFFLLKLIWNQFTQLQLFPYTKCTAQCSRKRAENWYILSSALGKTN